MRAGVPGHVLDEADDRHIALFKQLACTRGIDQREVLRGGDQHRAVGLVLLQHRQLHVARARRQVDQQQLGIAPVGVDHLAQRIARHRPAPRQRLARCGQVPHRQHPHPERTFERDQLFVFRLGLQFLGRQQLGLRGSVDVAIDHADFPALPRQRHREVGGEGRFADPALARSDRDRAAAPALRDQRDAHFLHAFRPL